MKKIKLLLLLAVGLLATSTTTTASPQQNKSIEQFVQERFPNATIIDRETEYSSIGIEIIYKGKEIDLLFDNNGKWLKTKWDVRKSDLPREVLNSVKSSPFSSYKIDDIEYHESPTSKFYEIELEKWIGDKEAKLYITPEGEIL